MEQVEQLSSKTEKIIFRITNDKSLTVLDAYQLYDDRQQIHGDAGGHGLENYRQQIYGDR